MKPTVYIETTIIGYLAMRSSRDILVAANQQITRDWWENDRQRYDLLVSRFVFDECAAGDPVAAQERLVYLHGIPIAEVSGEVEPLARVLIKGVPLPAKAELDAFHVAAAAVNSIEFLLTWNCTHLANADLRPRIERLCRAHGFEPPTICTPPELMEIKHGT